MPLSRSLRPARAALRTLLLLPLLAALCGCGPLWPIAPPDEDVMVTEPPLATAPSPRETLPESSPSAAPQGSPSPAAAPAASPSTTAEAAPAPTAVVLQGEAGEVSLPLALPPGLYRARIQFTGAGQIALTARSADGADQPLLDAPGPYEGEALLNGIPSGSLDALADGPWRVELAPLGTADDAAFGGAGDRVSGLFPAPEAGPWRLRHEGSGPFRVELRCVGGEQTPFEGDGPADVVGEIAFPGSYCYWRVHATGPWELSPA